MFCKASPDILLHAFFKFLTSPLTVVACSSSSTLSFMIAHKFSIGLRSGRLSLCWRLSLWRLSPRWRRSPCYRRRPGSISRPLSNTAVGLLCFGGLACALSGHSSVSGDHRGLPSVVPVLPNAALQLQLCEVS